MGIQYCTALRHKKIPCCAVPVLMRCIIDTSVDACPSFGPSIFSPRRGAPTPLFLACHRHMCTLPALTHIILYNSAYAYYTGIRLPPAQLDIQHARPHGSITGMPLRVAVAITRTSKYARTVPVGPYWPITRTTPFLGGSLALAMPKCEACYAAYFLITWIRIHTVHCWLAQLK
jgi:hypothetical protein